MTDGVTDTDKGIVPQKKGDAPGDDGSSSVPDPASWNVTFVMGCGLLAWASLVFYSLVATWPVPAADNKPAYAAFSFFCWKSDAMSADLRLFIMVIAAGALGSLLHSLTSFADYVGNRKLSKNWIWWIVLRTPIGIGLALLFYVVLRGGLIVPSFSTPATATPNSTALMNPYPIAAIAALAGMFSKQATDKVSEVFNTLFRMQQPVQRGDSLSDTTPVITSVEPGKLTVNGAKDLTIRGSHFQPECKVTVDGEARAAERVSETEIKLTLDAKDVAAVKKLALVVQNPGPTPHASKPFQVEVEP